MREDAATRSLLSEDNRRLRNELLVMGARQARLQVEADENARLRGLLGAAERGRLDVQLAPVLNVDLDPTRQRLLLDAGSAQGVHVGQSVIDAGGLLGQIVSVTPGTSTVLLLTDLDHAVPVSISRTGVRLIAYGSGRSDRLELRNIPVSSDVEVGDVVVTSGLGGRFPPGFPVGTIALLHPDDSHAFLIGELLPAAQLDRGRDVLLLRESRESRESGLGTRDSGLGGTGNGAGSDAGDDDQAIGEGPGNDASRVPSPESRVPAPQAPRP